MNVFINVHSVSTKKKVLKTNLKIEEKKLNIHFCFGKNQMNERKKENTKP